MDRQRHVNVVVVGGGAAGLAAAVAAQERGLTCQLLEAQTRLGGRVRTRTLKTGGTFDEGAQTINGDMGGVLDLVRSAGLHLAPVAQKGIGLCLLGDRAVRAETLPSLDDVFERLEDRSGRLGLVLDGLRALRRAKLDGATPWDGALSVSRALRVLPYPEVLPRGSLADALRALQLKPDEHTLATTVFAEILGRPAAEIDAGAVLDLWLNYASERDDLEFQIKGGMIGIIEALTARLSHTPRLGAPVAAIRTSPERVEVVTDDETWSTDHVIVAVPPPVAAKIAFDGEGCERLGTLFGAFASGDLIKSVLVFEKAFWRWRGLSGSAVFSDPQGLATVDGSGDGGGPFKLVAFHGGPVARQWAALPATGRQTLLLRHLARAFGEEAMNPIELADAVWVDDPWSGGGYNAILRAGAPRDAAARLASWGGRVMFAGAEIDDHFQGYVEGAIHSGRRAVDRIVHAMGTGGPHCPAVSEGGTLAEVA
ncbi:MAG: FAD-dependent oxidoreductase [Pseudomonadota bacterium]